MNTAVTVICASGLFLLAFALTVCGNKGVKRFIAGGLGGLSLLCAVNISAGLTGINIGLNAISLVTSFLLGVPGVFAVIGASIIL